MSETRSEYCGGSSIFVGLGGPQHYPIGGYKITEAGEKLLRSDDRLRQIESTLEWLTVAVNRDGGRLNKLENSQTAVDGNSREYYEQQIEEISGKWQAAEENLKRMTFLRDEASLEYARQINSHSGLISTIAELREKLGVANSVVEALNADVSQRNAIIMEKNREIEESRRILKLTEALNASLVQRLEVYEKHLPARELTAFMDDAKLGALVRQMPDGGYLIRLNNSLHACCNGESNGSKEWIKQAGEAIGV